MKLLFLNELGDNKWDEICYEMGIFSPWHCSNMLNYYAYSCGGRNHSFILCGGDGAPIAVCPIVVSEIKDPILGEYRSISIDGSALPSALITQSFNAHINRRNLRQLNQVICEFADNNNISEIIYTHRAYSYTDTNSPFFLTAGLLDFVSIGYMPLLRESIVIDLRKPEQQLGAEMAQYHRKEINKAEKQGQRVLVLSSESKEEEVNFYFSGYEKAHFAAAGRKTRPKSSFDLMREMILKDQAVLFVSFMGEVPLSYLYCGHRNGQAFGWSQVNVTPKIVDSPRHLLEWSAILFYKEKGYYLYDVGPKNQPGQVGLNSSSKLESISFFKERFGGVISPEITYTKILKKELAKVKLGNQLSVFTEESFWDCD